MQRRPISFQFPEPWITHSVELRKCRGTACFAALATHFGVSSPRRLEELINNRMYVTRAGDRTSPGTYLKWKRDGAYPSNEIIEKILQLTLRSVNLYFWRDHKLWDALRLFPEFLVSPREYIESLPSGIQEVLKGEPAENDVYSHPRFCTSDQQVLRLRDIRSLDAFVALLFLSRYEQRPEITKPNFLPAICLMEIFPYVIHQHPQLRFDWERLFICTKRILFRHEFACSKEHVEAELKKLAESGQGIFSPPL